VCVFFRCITRWQTCIAPLTLLFCFGKRATNYKAFVLRVTHTDKASHAPLAPCIVTSIGFVQRKSPITSGSFAKRDLHLKASDASLIPCIACQFWNFFFFWKGPERVSRICMSDVAHMNEPYHTYEGVLSHIWLCHVKYDWVISHTWMCHVTHMNESCCTYECVISHIWMSHVTHMNDSCHTNEWVMSHIWLSHVISHISVWYGVATISRLLKITGLFCKRAL